VPSNGFHAFFSALARNQLSVFCFSCQLCMSVSAKLLSSTIPVDTRSSATADGPRDALCQSRSCQLLKNSVGTSCTTNPEQNRSKGVETVTVDRRRINIAHPAMTRSTVVSVIHRCGRRRVCWSHHRLAIAIYFLSTEFGHRSGWKYNYFWRYPNFFITQLRIGQRKPTRQKPALSTLSFRYNTGLIDRRTDTRVGAPTHWLLCAIQILLLTYLQDDGISRASISSRCS